MRLSEIVLVSSAGETLARKKFRYNITHDVVPIFQSKLHTASAGLLEPHFVESGVHYYHIKRQQIYMIATSITDTLALGVIEFITRLYQLIKDLCGAVTPASIRANLVLVMEVLSESMDYGFVQLSSTEKIKPYIQSEPVPVKSQDTVTPGLFGVEHRLAPSEAADKPVIKSRWEQEVRKNEVFVDVIERINILLASDGHVLRSELCGIINMKSFLDGSPEVKVGLNEDLLLGEEGGGRGYGGTACLDQCSFHECVDTTALRESRILSVRPVEGQFAMMSYSINGGFPLTLPFRVYSYTKDTESTRDLEVGLKLCCDIPDKHHAVNLTLSLPVPISTTGLSQRQSGAGQSAQLLGSEQRVVWTIKKIMGQSEASAHFKLLDAQTGARPTEVGPVALSFEVSGFVCSNLQVRFLRVYEREHSYVPSRWVRYITTADSYVCKLS